MAVRDYYDALGVPETADEAAIRAAYLRLIKRVHPDVNGHPGATAQAALLNEAYRVLTDPGQRALYDLRRRNERAAFRRSVWYYVAWDGGAVAPEAEAPPTPRPPRPRRGATRPRHRPRPYQGDVPGPSLSRLSRVQRERLLLAGQLLVEWRYLDTSRVCRCYRCGHVWRSRNTLRTPRQCPACRHRGWSYHRLFHCLACGGLFESGDCFTVPTDLFSRCPHCHCGEWYTPSRRRSLLDSGALNGNGYHEDGLLGRARAAATARR